VYKKIFVVFFGLAFLLVVIYLFILQPHQIVGTSMEPSIKNRQVYLVNKAAYLLASPNRGDVVVYEVSSKSYGDFIGRIISLPGEAIKITEDGKVYINQKLLDEPYIEGVTYVKGSGILSNEQEVVVPENEFFVLGDNRYHSSDSRQFGFVKRSDIVGKLVTCILNCK